MEMDTEKTIIANLTASHPLHPTARTPSSPTKYQFLHKFRTKRFRSLGKFFMANQKASSEAHHPETISDASAQEYCQGSHGSQAGSALVLDVAKRPRVFAVDEVPFVRGTARYRTWCELKHRPLGWASRSLQREFAQVIMVEVRIEEMYGSD
jgi:hypothetical protein